MQGQQYVKSQFDHYVYLKKLADSSFINMLVYVDDMLIASKSVIEVERMKHQLSKEFEMKELGEAHKILGKDIHRDKLAGKVWLS